MQKGRSYQQGKGVLLITHVDNSWYLWKYAVFLALSGKNAVDKGEENPVGCVEKAWITGWIVCNNWYRLCKAIFYHFHRVISRLRSA